MYGSEGSRRLRERGTRGHQIVHENHPSRRQEPRAARHDLQCPRQVREPSARPEPRLVRDRAPLPQHGHDPRLPARPPQPGRRGPRDPSRRIVATRPYGAPRGRHRYEEQRSVLGPLSGPCGGLHGPREGTAQGSGERERAAFLVGEEQVPYGVGVRRGGMHHRQPGGRGRGPHPARCRPCQGVRAGRAQLRPRSAAASAGDRQHQPGDLAPPPPHGSTVRLRTPPGHPCGKRAPGPPEYVRC